MAEYTCDLGNERTTDVKFCTACNFNFCRACWARHPPHKKALLGPGGLPHEEADPRVVHELTECMAEPTEDEEYLDYSRTRKLVAIYGLILEGEL